MKKHFVTFLSPGTMVVEQTTKEISSWNTKEAISMSKDIEERHAALPYGFYFTTKKRGCSDFDSKETKRSNMCFLGGKVVTLKYLKAQNDPNDSTLISNMEINNWDRVVVNTNSWKWTQPLKANDVILTV